MVEPVIVGGRVWGDFCDHRSECDHEFDVESLDDLQDCVDEGSPAQMGLHSRDEYEVSIAVVERQAVHIVGRPFNDPLTVWADPDVGSAFVEVEELVGVDVG